MNVIGLRYYTTVFCVLLGTVACLQAARRPAVARGRGVPAAAPVVNLDAYLKGADPALVHWAAGVFHEMFAKFGSIRTFKDIISTAFVRSDGSSAIVLDWLAAEIVRGQGKFNKAHFEQVKAAAHRSGAGSLLTAEQQRRAQAFLALFYRRFVQRLKFLASRGMPIDTDHEVRVYQDLSRLTTAFLGQQSAAFSNELVFRQNALKREADDYIKKARGKRKEAAAPRYPVAEVRAIAPAHAAAARRPAPAPALPRVSPSDAKRMRQAYTTTLKGAVQTALAISQMLKSEGETLVALGSTFEALAEQEDLMKRAGIFNEAFRPEIQKYFMSFYKTIAPMLPLLQQLDIRRRDLIEIVRRYATGELPAR
jgi:hypothetical protein